MELDYSECEKSNAWQCLPATENAAEFTAEALRTRQYDAPVTVLSVQSKSIAVARRRSSNACETALFWGLTFTVQLEQVSQPAYLYIVF